MSESDSDQDHQPYAPPEADLEREQSEVGTEALYRAIIGERDTVQLLRRHHKQRRDRERYLERFRRFDESGGVPGSWHWPALFFAPAWLLFRRMYLVWALYFFLPSLFLSPFPEGAATESTAPPDLAQLFSDMSNQDIALFVGWVVYGFVVPAIFADSVYWWHANRMIRRAGQKFADPIDQIAWLRKRGGTSWWFLPIIFVLLPLLWAVLESIA